MMNDNDETESIESIESGEWESVKDFNAGTMDPGTPLALQTGDRRAEGWIGYS